MGKDLARLLSKYGYQITRQKGSHVRLTTKINGEHHITIPNHKPLKIGTISGLLTDISGYLKIDKQALIIELFK